MRFGDWLKKKRAARGLSMATLGASIGVGPSQVALMEAGTRRPSYETALRIARAFGENSDAVLKLAGHTPVETANAG